MSHDNDNRRKSTRNNKKNDGKFRSKKIKHDPQAESARAVYGLQDTRAQSSHDQP